MLPFALPFAFPFVAAPPEGVLEFFELLVEFAEMSLNFVGAIFELVALCLRFFAVALDLLGRAHQFLEMCQCFPALTLQLPEMLAQFSLGMLPFAASLSAVAFAVGEVLTDFIGLAFQMFGAVVLAGFAQLLNLPLEVMQAFLKPGVFITTPFALLAVLARGEFLGNLMKFLSRLFPHFEHEVVRLVRSDKV